MNKILIDDFLFKLNYSLIVGTSLPLDEENSIRKFVISIPSVDKIISFQTEVMAPSKVRLSMEIEFQGRQLLDPENISKEVSDLRNNEQSSTSILVKTHDRAIRSLGPEIDELEKKIQENFPSILLIDIEPN